MTENPRDFLVGQDWSYYRTAAGATYPVHTNEMECLKADLITGLAATGQNSDALLSKSTSPISPIMLR